MESTPSNLMRTSHSRVVKHGTGLQAISSQNTQNCFNCSIVQGFQDTEHQKTEQSYLTFHTMFQVCFYVLHVGLSTMPQIVIKRQIKIKRHANFTGDGI